MNTNQSFFTFIACVCAVYCAPNTEALSAYSCWISGFATSSGQWVEGPLYGFCVGGSTDYTRNPNTSSFYDNCAAEAAVAVNGCDATFPDFSFHTIGTLSVDTTNYLIKNLVVVHSTGSPDQLGIYNIWFPFPGGQYTNYPNLWVPENTIDYYSYSSLATIWGNVTCTSDGSAIQGASVNIGMYSATSDSVGSYFITNLPPVSYTATVAATGYITLTNTVRLLSAGQVVNANFTLSPFSNNITGHVYCTCDGSPITNALVQIGTYSATSGSGGSYSIANVSPGNYSAIVSKTNYYTITTNLTLLSGSTTVTQNFTLTPLPALNVSLFRVLSPQAHVTASDAIDAPIQPVTLPSVLATANPLGLGVVADEVTPVLFQFTARPPTTTSP
jgi:hypothetical protein